MSRRWASRPCWCATSSATSPRSTAVASPCSWWSRTRTWRWASRSVVTCSRPDASCWRTSRRSSPRTTRYGPRIWAAETTHDSTMRGVRMRSWSKVFGAVLVAGWSLFGSLAAAQTATVTVRGRVVDTETKQGVDLADVVLVGTDRHATSDDQGRFVLEGVTPGAYTLSVQRLGYAPLRRQVAIAENTTPEFDLALARTAIPLAEVTVTPGSFSFMGQGTGTRQSMSREDVEAVPQVGNDIFRAVNRLPGLASNDYAAHFGVRGGRHDETLILLDGLELYEPYHLKDFNEGAISIIDASTIDGVQLMTGGFPARYGNRRSGVFDIQSRTPDVDHTVLSAGTSFLNSHAMAMGGFGGGKGSWLAFGRMGYMGLVFQMIDQADLPNPQYGDAFGKVTYKLTPNQKLNFDILHAGDKYKYDIEATTGFLDT